MNAEVRLREPLTPHPAAITESICESVEYFLKVAGDPKRGSAISIWNSATSRLGRFKDMVEAGTMQRWTDVYAGKSGMMLIASSNC